MNYYMLDFKILDVIEHYITKNITVTKMLPKLQQLHITYFLHLEYWKIFSILSFLFFNILSKSLKSCIYFCVYLNKLDKII